MGLSTSGKKSQFIRVLDVFVYGPILIWVALQVKQNWLKIILIFMGATTMSYNARNFLAEDKKDNANFDLIHPASV